MDINKIRKQEEERLKKVNILHEENKRKHQKRRLFLRILCGGLAFLCVSVIVLLSESWYIQRQLKTNEENSLSRVNFLMKIPGGNLLISQNIKYFLNDSIEKFNNGFLNDTDMESCFKSLEEQNLSMEQSKLIGGLRDSYHKFVISKNALILGSQYEENGNYIDAMDEYQKVIKEDKNYSMTVSKIADMKDRYIEAVIQSVYDSMTTFDNRQSSINLINKAVEYFPDNTELLAYQSAGENIGNPMYYKIAEIFCEQLKTIEKDVNHTAAECKEITIYSISNTSVMVSATFHNNYPPACYFYYKIDANEKFQEVSAEDFAEMLNQTDKIRQITFEWDEDLGRSDKQSLLLENMAYLKDSDAEKFSSTSAEKIIANADAMQERTESNSGGIDLLPLVFGELAVVVFIVWLIVRAVKDIFK